MTFISGSRALPAFAALVLGAALSAGCSSIRDHQGYLVDEPLIAAIQPGIDNKDSVTGTLGRPSFVGQFDQAQSDWYYVSRDTRQAAFTTPRPSAQTVLRVHFDAAGNVESVQRTGVELAVNIDPDNRRTPTLGRDRSLLQELFGNIGAVGQRGQSAPTADNPN
ncbi:MAG TPA: outer membrane protein assembly factor BamE [Allosphingosinicella sp.]|jgi:outer membrane protein assembly factor BamE (lipoprotein component of BamABCDE complex)|nr:outer membrane protein assembly factor BamE [Allosphingosinicella sp.]